MPPSNAHGTSSVGFDPREHFRSFRVQTPHQGDRPMKPLLALLCLLLIAPAHALILVQKGNAPTQDHDWPAGSLALANLKQRAGYWEGPPFGGGRYVFE